MKKILVVEDDPVNLQILTDYLGANGYAMRAAVNGVEGIAAFHSEQPDLMLIDVQLPRKSGFEVCFEVKRTAAGAQMPVLLMSAVYTPKDERDRLAAPSLAAGYLTKPFDLGQLLAKVQTLIGPAA
ncbi:MAG: response regulator transcription factor [Myxococcales bacterium]|nr:response regulator transcription factor [Myxococcales bacterium]MBK7193625.1 response regulator transcription factor [Myxococcales bacterium]MBL8626820.1 response regulator transcription factor [Myxococcales bacterium]MBP6844539.1 response regulator transcription factor [Kofleriaceae bacterium]